MNERELRVLHKIIDSLRAIQQDIHAIYHETRSEGDEEHPPNQVDIQSEIRLPPAVNDYYASENTEGPKDRRRDRVRLWLEGIALLAAVLAAILAYNAYLQTRRQAKAAETQAGIMREQLEVSDRPWVKLVGIKFSMLTFIGPHGGKTFGKMKSPIDIAALHIKPEIQNVGRSTATHIRVRTILALHKWQGGWGDFTAEEKIVCQALSKEDDANMNRVLFPDETSSDINYGAQEFVSEEHISHEGRINYIAPALIGCIDYQFGTSPKHHQTKFIYEVFRADYRTRIFLIGQDMRNKQLLLIRDPQHDSAD